MQTFLPYASFYMSARVLDNQRLGKQRVETLQIMKALHDPEYGWQNHPAVLMWRGHEDFLMEYQAAVCDEWVYQRGFRDTCLEKTRDYFRWMPDREEYSRPPWLGNHEFHLSHRSNLTRKNPEHYSQYWTVDPTLPYIWPVAKEVFGG